MQHRLTRSFTLPFVLAAGVHFSCAAAAQTPPSSFGAVRDLTTPAPAFDGDEAKMAAFMRAVGDRTNFRTHSATPEAEARIADWSQQALTKAGRKVTATDATRLPAEGCRNYGVYGVTAWPSGDAFIVKRGNRPFEPVHIALVQQSLGDYPADLARRDMSADIALQPGDAARAARVVPLLYWEYTFSRAGEGSPIDFLPVMLFEQALGDKVTLPPANLPADAWSAHLKMAYALGESLSLWQLPALAPGTAPPFERPTWRHDDLHFNNFFFDPDRRGIEMIDCMDMRYAPGWQRDIQTLTLHRNTHPLTSDFRQAWSRALGEGYLSRARGLLHEQLREAFTGTLFYELPLSESAASRVW